MGTWYAQNSSVNIDSVNEWNSAANGSGSWLTWADLGAADVLNSNGKTAIAINVNVTCGRLVGATVEGGFIVSSGVTITASIGGLTAVTTSGVGYTLTIVGNITSSEASGKYSFRVASACTVNITGNVTSGSYYNQWAMAISAAATVTITGNVGGGLSHSLAISAGTVVVNGNVTGPSNYNSFYGIIASGSSVVTVNGNVTGNVSAGISNSGTSTVTVTGDVTAGGSFGFGVHCESSTAATITGNLICSATGFPIAGKINWTPASGQNIQMFGAGGAALKVAPELLDHQILAGVVNGSITGNRVDCPAAKAIESSGDYGDPASPLVGTYHEATEAEVQAGVTFGALSALTGTYSGGGGAVVGPFEVGPFR